MRDYSQRAAQALVALLLAVILLGAIPPLQIFGLELRRVDLLSLFESSLDNIEISESERVFSDNVEYDFDRQQIALQAEQSSIVDSLPNISYRWVIDNVATPRNTKLESEMRKRPLPLVTDGAVAIEDFDTVEHSAMSRLYDKLLNTATTTRIAVMGDSFVEGDILTSDLREMMQLRYGGCGAGFAPFSSPLTKFRRTVATNSKGWKSNNVMQRKSAAAADVDMFTISGWLSRPSEGASVEWRTTQAKRGNEMARSARIIFVAQQSAELEVEINDSKHRRKFAFDGAEFIRHIDIEADSIYSVKVNVLSGSAGFAGYGVIFDGASGVSLDNYSVRSNSGHAMFWSNASLNAQINRAIGGYDLIILQYGLNIMAQDVHNYDNYAERLEDMVEYIRGCFPDAAIMIMGVSERYVKHGEKYEPMNSIGSFVKMQREVAQRCAVAFWPTNQAFTIRGGMRHFVEQGWAGKDYTHINFNGGREVAYALADAINTGLYRYSQSLFVKEIQEPILKGEIPPPYGSEVILRPLNKEDIPHLITDSSTSKSRWRNKDSNHAR